MEKAAKRGQHDQTIAALFGKPGLLHAYLRSPSLKLM